MFNGQKDGKEVKEIQMLYYTCEIKCPGSYFPVPSLYVGWQSTETTAPSWMGNASSTLLIPTSLNTYMRVCGGRLQPHPLSITNNSSGLHQFLETEGLLGPDSGSLVSTPDPELWKPPHHILSCKSHNLFHDNPSPTPVNYHFNNFSESKKIVTEFFCEW